MPSCCECEADIDVDEFDIDRGDELSCRECGANLMVSGVSPIEFELVEEDLSADDEEQADDGEDEWT